MNSPTRPKVLVVVTVATTARLFMRGYVEYLAENGYDVILAANDLEEFREEFESPHICVQSISLTRNPNPIRDLRGLIDLLKVVKSSEPDAIIYATPKASLLSSLAGFLMRVPVRIYHLWGIRFETTGGPKKLLLKFLEKLTAILSTAIVANGNSLADRAAQLGIATRSRIEVPGKGSSHGVDAERFSPDAIFQPIDSITAEFLNQESGFTIGFIGRLHPDKGVDTLLAAAEQLHKYRQNFKIVLVGGDEGMQDEIDSRSYAFPVRVTGEVGDVRPYIKEFDILVLMSLREGFPNVVLEAAAMSVPAIVSNATGCIDSVVDGETGRIIPVGDVVGLSIALRDLIQNPSLLQKLGMQARQRVIADFRPQDVWARTEEILKAQIYRRVGLVIDY